MMYPMQSIQLYFRSLNTLKINMEIIDKMQVLVQIENEDAKNKQGGKNQKNKQCTMESRTVFISHNKNKVFFHFSHIWMVMPFFLFFFPWMVPRRTQACSCMSIDSYQEGRNSNHQLGNPSLA